jgi:hypothetical protein
VAPFDPGCCLLTDDLVEVPDIMRALNLEVVDAPGQRSSRCFHPRIGRILWADTGLEYRTVCASEGS